MTLATLEPPEQPKIFTNQIPTLYRLVEFGARLTVLTNGSVALDALPTVAVWAEAERPELALA